MKILWLYPKHYWECKMSSVRRHSLVALARHPEVDLHISGIGWDDYDLHKTVEENRTQIMPQSEIVGWYKPLGEAESHLRPEDETPLKDPKGCTVPCCLRFNEAWWPERLAMREVVHSGTSLVICHHAEDLPQFEPLDSYEVTSVHLPHCAEQRLFDASSRGPSRDIPVLLTGSITSSLDRDLYPLRERFMHLIIEKRIPGRIRQKPAAMTTNLAETDAQLIDYATELARAKIVVMDGTSHRYPLAKYTEAAMSGALVIGNMPRIPPKYFDEFVIDVALGSSDEEIVNLIHYWLDNAEEREKRAKRGREICLEHYSQERYAERLLETFNSFLTTN